jgi:hydroxyethylthiazole kinase-like sugar kinase family protein
MYPPSSWIFGLSLFIAHSLRPLVNAANKHSAELVRRSHSLSLLRNAQVLEDAERLIAAWNERQAKRMPMLFSPTTAAAIAARYWFCPELRRSRAAQSMK